MPDSELVTEDIVHSARNGDPAAFRVIYEVHHERVFAVCARMSSDRDRAKDLTQEVFVKVWEKLRGFRGESSLGTWIHRVAVNLALMDGRSTARRERRFEAVADTDELGHTSRDDMVADRLDLEGALAKLPDGARQVFVLREMEGYDYAEISRLMGISEGTARSQLYRARQLLMQSLAL